MATIVSDNAYLMLSSGDKGDPGSAKSIAAGTLLPWSTALLPIPPGFLPCDGVARNNADFPVLSEQVEDAWKGVFTFTIPLAPGWIIAADNTNITVA